MWVTPINSSQSDTLQVKFSFIVKQIYWCYKREAELNKFAAAYPDIVLDEEIDKLHFQDASMKQVMKDLVAWPALNLSFSLLDSGRAEGGWGELT